MAIVDSHYYSTRPQDNFNPTVIGDQNMIVPTYDMGLYYSGGNFQPGPNNSGFITSLINSDNTAAQGFDLNAISELYQRYQGIDTLHVFPRCPARWTALATSTCGCTSSMKTPSSFRSSCRVQRHGNQHHQ